MRITKDGRKIRTCPEECKWKATDKNLEMHPDLYPDNSCDCIFGDEFMANCPKLKKELPINSFKEARDAIKKALEKCSEVRYSCEAAFLAFTHLVKAEGLLTREIQKYEENI
jgi:hypothetical protein